MKNPIIDKERGNRIITAMRRRGRSKAMALAAELGVSAAAVSKWKRGHTMSLENACVLAECLDVSLDWLAMNRNVPEWLQEDQLNPLEIELLEKIQRRPKRILKTLLAIVSEIPERVDTEWTP